MIPRVALGILAGINLLAISYFVLLNLFYLATGLTAFRFLRRYVRRLKTLDVGELIRVDTALPVTVLAPAYNEEATCVDATRALLALHYPDFEIIVVNDGSKDRTLEGLRETFELAPTPRLPIAELPTAPLHETYRSRRHPNLWVVDKANGGKADAINAGLNLCRTPLFCVIDMDSLLEPEALLRVSRPFLEDTRTVACGGIIRIVNGSKVRSGVVSDVRMPRNLLARFQILEYLRAFHAGRVGWAELNATLIISGAFGLFRRSLIVDAGGFANDTVGEDMEMVVRLNRYCRDRNVPHRISYVPDPVAWTECPETLETLGRQRDRWQRGLVDSLTRHKRMLFNPRYGTVGLLAFPYFFFLEMLGPAIELVGYCAFAITVALGLASPPYILAFLALAIAFGIALSILAVGLEEVTFRRYHRTSDLLRLLWLAIIENIGYRQINSWWRIRGTLSSLRGSREWGHMRRKGFRADR